MQFLPTSKKELQEREIDLLDFIVVSADAYVDHPTFGHALIGRLVESYGFSVGVIAQPVSDNDYKKLGMPTKAFLVSGGVVDSMVNNYNVSLTRRTEDVYSEDGKMGKRPDRATTVYCKALKKLFPDTPVIAGGIEASLRRLSHYDYWSDSVMRSICYDAPADLFIYGMGENPIAEICTYASKNIPLNKVKNIKGTFYLADSESASKDVKKAIADGDKSKYINISSHDRVCGDKKLYLKAFMMAYENTDPFTAKGIIQKQDYQSYAVVNPPSLPVTTENLDKVYALDFMRAPHPSYNSVPAINEVKFSVSAHRGCYGNCSFCALTYHQGRIIQPRSEDNIIEEVEKLTKLDDFKGYIHDIGGPSANFHKPACDKQKTLGVCKNKECIGFKKCDNLKIDQSNYLNVLRRARAVKGVKKVFVRSGVRYDYLMADKDKSFFNELVTHHVSGQLKVAPEHVSENVLKLMNKPTHGVYKEFCDEFEAINKKLKKEQYLVPYFISSHPGCTIKDAVKLTEYLMDIHYMPLQVQDFYPTPSTLSTTMFYTELDPSTQKQIYVAKTKEEKSMQRALMQYRKPNNRALVVKGFKLAKREDLTKRLPSNTHLTKK